MPRTFLLLRLLQSELHQLELLRRLEVKLKVVPPHEKARVQGEIDRAMEEVSVLSRKIQDLKSKMVLAPQS